MATKCFLLDHFQLFSKSDIHRALDQTFIPTRSGIFPVINGAGTCSLHSLTFCEIRKI